MVIPVLGSFSEHSYIAEESGCVLATASDEDELAAIADAATAEPYDGPRGEFNLFLIGLRRPSDAELSLLPAGPGRNPRNGFPGGPWMWTDGCTNYSFNPFASNQGGNEPNNAPPGNERVGGVLFTNLNALRAGDINDIDDTGYPALYECCVL